MARKSRKPNRQGNPVTVNIPITVAVGYVRLSVEDRDGKGSSIETQKQIILRYLEDHPDFQLLKIYEDDGVSGRTYDRPGFSEMISDAESGRFSCILVKDVSRLGRNYVETGYYVEKMLPSISVRFISITDDYDSAKDGITTSFTLKSLLSEAHAVDIGRKVKSAIRSQMESGRYIGSRAPYGYLKSSGDKHQLVVDEAAAHVITQIFQWAADGKTIFEIVRSLNHANIVTPSHHWFRMGIIQNIELLGEIHWQPRTVQNILKNEIYTGTMVRGKTESISRKQLPVPQDKWLHVENTHPAIISQELFAAVQERLSGKVANHPEQKNGQYTPNLFKGKIFCGHCGRRLDRKKNHQNYIYRCTANYVMPGSCPGNSIREEALIEAVSKGLLEYAASADDRVPNFGSEKPIDIELAELQVVASYDEGASRILYEAMVTGKIMPEEFLDAKAKHNHRESLHKQQWVQFSSQRAEQAAIEIEKQELFASVMEFQNTRFLTRGLVGQLVNRIGVQGDGLVFVELKVQR